MDDSILTSIKQSVSIVDDYHIFDRDLVMYANSVFMALRQFGVGPENGYHITDANDRWSDFLPEDDPNYYGVQTYVCNRVRLMFDPPANSTLLQALKENIAEFEWRLSWEYEMTL